MMKLRSNIFFLLDTLRKNRIKAHLNDLKQPYNEKKAMNNLNKLLEFAVNNSNYYSSLKGFKGIQDFPIINKNIIKDNYDNFKTHYFDSDNHIMKTSGSSGVPFKIHQDVNKRNRVIAELIYYNSLAGYKIGSKLLYFKNHNNSKKIYYKDFLIKNIKNIDVKNLNEENLEYIYLKMKKDKNFSILGYASAIENIGIYIKTKGLSLDKDQLNTIIATSELLTERNKTIWNELTGKSIISRYANQENGFLAQSDENGDHYRLNHNSYFFEFLRINEDKYAQPGEKARIVITDLYNKSIPVIRYDTGDIGTFDYHFSGEKILKTIEGRLRDYIYSSTGDLLSPSIITKSMWDFEKVSGFQFIQTDKNEYELKIVDEQKYYTDEAFIREIQPLLGDEAFLSINRVGFINKLPSGKVQLVKNDYI